MGYEFDKGYSNPHGSPPNEFDWGQQGQFRSGQAEAGRDASKRAADERESRQRQHEADKRERIRVANLTPEERAREAKNRVIGIMVAILFGGYFVLTSGFGISPNTIIYTLLGLAGVWWALRHGKARWVALILLASVAVVGGRWVWWVTQGKKAYQQETQRWHEQNLLSARREEAFKRESDSLSRIYAAQEGKRLENARRASGH